MKVSESRMNSAASVITAALVIWGTVAPFASSNAEEVAPGSKAQIEAGVAVYAQQCQHCHSEKLAGGAGPALRGDDFAAQWEGKPLRALYGRILMTMPYDNPGSLTPDQVLSLVSYIASENEFARWDSPFTSPNELTKLTIGRSK